MCDAFGHPPEFREYAYEAIMEPKPTGTVAPPCAVFTWKLPAVTSFFMYIYCAKNFINFRSYENQFVPRSDFHTGNERSQVTAGDIKVRVLINAGGSKRAMKV